MTKKAHQDILEELHSRLAATMLTTLSGGEATAADLNVIRQFLKDNKIEAAAVQDNPLDKLAKTLPFQSATDDAEDYLPN